MFGHSFRTVTVDPRVTSHQEKKFNAMMGVKSIDFKVSLTLSKKSWDFTITISLL